jgi:DNA-binding SARP family transcriptional activator
MADTEFWSLGAVAALTPAAAAELPLTILVDVVGAATEPELVAHPRALLHLARAFEPGQRLTERTAALVRLAAINDNSDHELAREIMAERAIDSARVSDLDEAEALARAVLLDAGPGEVVARARASEAFGRMLAWRGDRPSAREAARHLDDAALAYRELGTKDWEGQSVYWHGTAVLYQHGELDQAEVYLRRSLEIFDPLSPRRGVVLTFLADLLTMKGDWSGVDAALDEALSLGVLHGDLLTRAYVSWQWARVASLRGDASATARYLLETERHAADWFDITTGPTFLADAAELLDRVGDQVCADEYLRRARERAPDDEFVLQAGAALLARRGDPEQALTALQDLTRVPWLEPRLAWRRTLLTAYASLRSGRDGVGVIAARALTQAAELGDARIALVGEPEIMTALLPLAAAAGSDVAVELLAPGDTFVVRLLGDVSVHRGGAIVDLPSGVAGQLVRLLALHPAGLETEAVFEMLWPEEDPDRSPRRLRDVLGRLRTRAPGIVHRHGSQLRLAPAWVDASAFRAAADRALSDRSPHAGALAVAALALWSGDLLPTDPYASWAASPREQLRRRRLDLLDLHAADAAERGSREEARLALERAIEADPYDDSRYVTTAAHLVALGRREAARRMLRRGVAALRELDLDPSPELVRALAELNAAP